MKHFRIIPKDVSQFYSDMKRHIRYTIEQRHTILIFFHWWSTPEFAPPHSFMSINEAMTKINEECKSSNIDIKDLT